MKRIASIQDLSCIGKCSLGVALPVLSVMGLECAALPTAVLSAHTAFEGFVTQDLTGQIEPIAAHWQQLELHFDAVYTGYLATAPQVPAGAGAAAPVFSDPSLCGPRDGGQRTALRRI